MEAPFSRLGWRLLIAILSMVLAGSTGCGSGAQGNDDDTDETDESLRRKPSTFVSADWPSYGPAFSGEEEEEEEEEEEREIEEGDIYRVLGDGFLLNVNTFRGLQVIDVHDLSHPKMTARLPVAGTPIEMYVLGNRALVLLNDWVDYSGRRGDINVTERRGATVLMVDVGDRQKPRLLAQQWLEGYIRTSRVARGGGGESLYVASTRYRVIRNASGESEYRPETVVTSYDVTSSLAERSRVSLGGEVSAIHAEANELLVARLRPGTVPQTSDVALIDISSPDGKMVLQDSVPVSGHVLSQFHMDLQGGMLRVFSGPQFNDRSSSHLQTFDARDPTHLRPLDDESFGSRQSIFAAVFLPDRAFAVTYLRKDPFHAFAIDPQGKITEHPEFIVSGWNDFFRPVLGGTRLIGIGVDDAGGGRRLAASLYDITNLDNPKPLVAREVVSGKSDGWSWSEANWDHRAFTVLDDAVDATAPNGTKERGLVLLPFNAAHFDGKRYVSTSAVQIFSYSGTTLTRRGIMDHGSPVRRSFLVDANDVINLSETDLSVFDDRDLDAPVKRGSLELAPDYVAIFAFGDYRVRVKNPSNAWEDPEDTTSTAVAEVVRKTEPADTAKPIARIAVPKFARYLQSGNLLVSVRNRYLQWPKLETTVDVVDFSNPTAPRAGGQLQTSELPGVDGYWFEGRTLQTVRAMPNAIAFVRPVEHEGDKQDIRECNEWVRRVPDCYWEDRSDGCSFLAGQRTCRKVGGAAEVCNGGFARCTTHGERETTCVPASDAGTERYCNTFRGGLRTLQLEVRAVDLTVPSAPTLTAPLPLPKDEDGVGTAVDGSDLLLTVKQPATVPEDPRPHARYYVRRVGLAAPSHPTLGARINVPGKVADVGGRTLFTHDFQWAREWIESAVARLAQVGPSAHLRNYRRFADRRVDAIVVDDHRMPVVSHDAIWGAPGTRRLTLLGPHGGSGDFAVLSDHHLTLPWASLLSAEQHWLFLQIPDGTLMVDLRDPTRPEAQAFLRYAWNGVLIDAGEVLAPAGPFGIQEIGLSQTNLLWSDRPAGVVRTKKHKK